MSNAELRRQGASTSEIQEDEGHAFAFFDRAKALETRVDRTIDELGKQDGAIETRLGSCPILRFRRGHALIYVSGLGGVMISLKTGAPLKGQEINAGSGLAASKEHLELRREVFKSKEPMIPGDVARALAKRLGALELTGRPSSYAPEALER